MNIKQKEKYRRNPKEGRTEVRKYYVQNTQSTNIGLKLGKQKKKHSEMRKRRLEFTVT